MAQNLFSTYKMIEAIKDIRQSNTWLRDTFFSKNVSFDTEFVQYDVKEYANATVPFSAPRIGGTPVERTGFHTVSVKPAHVAPYLITTAEDALKRAPGENPYQSQDPMQRSQQILADDLISLDYDISRTEEIMCAQALLTGGIDIKGEGVDEEVLFWNTRNGGVNDPYKALAGTSLWDAAATAVPLQDLNDAVRAISRASGVMPTHAIMGTKALDAFINCEQIQKYLDLRHIDFGNVSWPENGTQYDGVRYWGHVGGLDIYSYESQYFDGSADTEIFDPKKVLLGSAKADTIMCYGPNFFNEEGKGTFCSSAPRVPASWYQQMNPAGRIVQIQSSPLPVIQRKSCFYVLKVLG